MTDRTEESERLKRLLAGHYQKGRQEMREEIHCREKEAKQLGRQDREVELSKAIKDFIDEGCTLPDILQPLANHSFEDGKYAGKQEAMAEFEKKYPNFRTIYDDAFVEGAFKMRDEIKNWISINCYRYSNKQLASIELKEFDAKFKGDGK